VNRLLELLLSWRHKQPKRERADDCAFDSTCKRLSNVHFVQPRIDRFEIGQ
jgi:hypothetical protein